MDQNQPKKRGRKKKVKIEEQPPINIEPKKVEIKEVEKLPELKIVPKISIPKEQVTKKLEGAIKELDEALKPEKIMASIQKKMLTKVITNSKIEHTMKNENELIYQKILNSNATKDEIQLWEDKISYEMARKMCVIIGFLLQNGPLNMIEKNILENAVNALRSYYEERENLISINKQMYLKTTFFPDKNTEVFKFLIEVIGMSLLIENFDEIQ